MIHTITENKSFHQVVKFVVTGGMNTLVDFAVLNLLILMFGLAQGDPKYIYFKGISYLIASTNSFIFNKWWVFKNQTETTRANIHKEIGSFATVTVIGLVVNTLVSLAVFHAGSTLFPTFGSTLLANIGAISGTLVVLVINFVTYKFIIFKK